MAGGSSTQMDDSLEKSFIELEDEDINTGSPDLEEQQKNIDHILNVLLHSFPELDKKKNYKNNSNTKSMNTRNRQKTELATRNDSSDNVSNVEPSMLIELINSMNNLNKSILEELTTIKSKYSILQNEMKEYKKNSKDVINSDNSITEPIVSEFPIVGNTAEATREIKTENIARIDTLENEVEKLRQVQNKNFLICNGPVIEDLISRENSVNLKQSFQTYINQNIILNNDSEIETVSYFGKSKKLLRVKCISVEVRNKILSAARRKKLPGVYFNELLTQQKNRLYFKMRELKRAHADKITSTYVRGGNIYYKLVNTEGFKLINTETEVTSLLNSFS